MTEMLNWPPGIDRTPESEREQNHPFSVRYNKTRRQLSDEMERLGVEEWRLDDVAGSNAEPGVVLRWTKNGRDYVVACDHYTSKKANIRATYLWLKETRKRNERPVSTANDQFAAAALPSGEATAAGGDAPDVTLPDDPYGFLGLTEDADEYLVEQAIRRKKARHHADGSDPDREKWKQAKLVEEEITDD